jgi:endonuclease III
MRGATQCAQRLQEYLQSLRTRLGKVNRPAVTDPTTQLVIGVLSRDMPESKARQALDAVRSMVVDFNELRVIPPLELADLLGDYPDARGKSEDIIRALNRIFAFEHTVSLERLRELPKKDMLAYLDRIDGLEAYTRARIRLLGLEKHAIPLDEAMWALARSEGLVDGKCSLEEAQAFLERQVPEDAALEVVALLHKQAWTELAATVRSGAVERIISVPPDRRTSHMLQDVAPVREPSFDAADEFDDAAPATPSPGRPTRKRRAAAPAKPAAKATAKPPRKRAAPAADGKARAAPRTTRAKSEKRAAKKSTPAKRRTAARSERSRSSSRSRRNSA